MARSTAKNGTTKERRQTRREDRRREILRTMHAADASAAIDPRNDRAHVAAMVDAVAAEIARRADRRHVRRTYRIWSLVDTLAPMVVAAATPRPPVVAFTTAAGRPLTLTVGTRVVVGWSGGYRGDGGWRGPGAVHRTETVAAIMADGTAVLLTGGRYKDGRGGRCAPGEGTRFLPLVTATGSPTRQILDVVD